MSTNKSILRSAGIISIATFLSRLLGFIRDVVIARLFGVYIYAQAFVIAFRIPNLLRDLVGEGAANAAFVPVFSEYKIKHTKEEFWELVNVVLNILLVSLAIITLLGIVFSPLIVRLIAPGFVSDPLKLETTIRLTRIIFPYILLIGLAAYSMAILNSLQHFSVPAFGPCLLNVSIIVFALWFGEGVKGLASGILIGGVLQLLIQVPVLYKKGFRINNFLRSYKHPAAKAIGVLMLPRLLSSSIYQLNNFVDSIFGSLATIVGEGGVAILYFAYRLIQFPIGIFSNALSQAILPTFSAQALEEDNNKLKHTLSFGLRSISFVMVPTSVFFMFFSKTIISALFMGGKFDVYSADTTASVLFFYSIGLFAYGSSKILQSCFFALKDTVTPTKVSGLALIVNIALNFLFMYPLRISGLALATSISGINTYFILFFKLRKKIGGFDVKEIFISFLKILAASICMGIVCYLVSQKQIFSGLDLLNRVLNLSLLLLAGSVSYAIFCFIFRVQEMRQLFNWIIKGRPSVPASQL